MFLAEDVLKLAKATLKDATATDEQKSSAREAIERINARAKLIKSKPKRPKRRDHESDAAYEQALFEFRSTLDKAAVVREAEGVLDDPNSSVYCRRKARETLYGPDPEPAPAESARTAESEAPEKSSHSHSRLTHLEQSSERILSQQFLDDLV